MAMMGEYALFGEIHTTEDGIPPLTVRQLPPPPASEDVRSSLLALHRELVVSVRDLLSLLTDRPSAYARALEAIGLIFRNMQHLTRVARPAQARAELVRLLERELAQRKAALRELRSATREGQEALELGLGGVRAQLEKDEE
ncbi:hypothetical protein H632_c565p0 [Helicosporidium sp. ATCC 50920]|nr:hypothetical protein H632_c565p0 [Helicosporidium sp. ATCC 50920]|eukprot:KDD75656.1 hypothetical protein H632_c565p0 [Helicosporidium sp. ATCC 50920]